MSRLQAGDLRGPLLRYGERGEPGRYFRLSPRSDVSVSNGGGGGAGGVGLGLSATRTSATRVVRSLPGVHVLGAERVR